MTDRGEIDRLNAENAALRSATKRAERHVRQLERLARTSEQLARQRRAAQQLSIEQLEIQSSDLREAKERLEEAIHAKDRFLATMSHEIRTPMNGVIGYIDLLETVDLGEDAAPMVATLKGSAETLMALLNDVLDFAKIEAGQLDVESVEFDAVQLVTDVIHMEAVRARSKAIALECVVDGAIERHVLGDPVRLRQVLVNLVNNAIKFTAKGGVAVEVSRGQSSDRVRFRVRDSGIGIPADKIEHIFEPFTQADGTTTRRFGGTGLGLSICRPLVRSMGGELTVESVDGEGTVFAFEVDLIPVKAPATETVQGSAMADGCEEGFSLEGTRVLVVDDNPVNRLLAEKMLLRSGCEPTLMCGGVAALDALGATEFDVVLMDCSMPEMDGFEATRRIRSLPGPMAQIPIVAMTAFAMAGDRERCLQAGMDDYIPKPVRLAELRSLLQRIRQGAGGKRDAA